MIVVFEASDVTRRQEREGVMSLLYQIEDRKLTVYGSSSMKLSKLASARPSSGAKTMESGSSPFSRLEPECYSNFVAYALSERI